MAFTMGYNQTFQPCFRPTFGDLSMFCTSSMTPFGQDFHCYVAPGVEAFPEPLGPDLWLDADLEAILEGYSQTSSGVDGSTCSDHDTESESDMSQYSVPFPSIGESGDMLSPGSLQNSNHVIDCVPDVKAPLRQKAAARNAKAKKTASVKPVVPKAKPVRAGKASETAAKSRTGKAPTRRGRGGEHKRRRDLHNDSERVRRSALRQSLENLRLLIPAVKDNPKIHTSQLLRHAVAYIRELEAEDVRLSRTRV